MQVLVAHEKHGEYYYAASTNEELGKSALKILTDRFNDGYWYHKPDEEDKKALEFIPGWNFDDDQETRKAAVADYKRSIAELDDEDVRKVKLQKLNRAIAEVNDYRKSNHLYKQIEDVVKAQDYTSTVPSWKTEIPLAWFLLDSRSDWEYERVELVSVWQPGDE